VDLYLAPKSESLSAVVFS